MAEAKQRRPRPALSETEIISRYFAPLAEGAPEAHRLQDDAALLPGKNKSDLVATSDTIVERSHFREHDAPEDVAFKALAVNVSDLTAKGADPYCYLLSLVLPRADPDWLAGFSRGLSEAQKIFGCRLVGGDTTAGDGPITISITAFGRIPKGAMVMRDGGKAGDRLYVSGTIGDAALGLRLSGHPELARSWRLEDSQAARLVASYLRPAPPVGLASALRSHASAALDVSDGLLGDAAKLCEASETGGQICSGDLPLSGAARQALSVDRGLLQTIMTGGDDYEVLAAIPDSRCKSFEAAAAEAGVKVRAIGGLTGSETGLNVLDEAGGQLRFDRLGFDHFA